MSTKRLACEEMLVVTYSDRSEAFYGFSNRYPLDIIIDAQYGMRDLVGKWIRVPLDSRRRACEKATIIEDRFPTRVLRKQVEVKCRIQFDGRDDHNIEMFRNEYFGVVADIEGILSDIKDGMEFDVWICRHKEDRLKCRWKVSIEQDAIQSCVRENMDEYKVKSSAGLKKVEGIITGYSRKSRIYLVWSDSRPRSTICLDPEFCFPNVSMIGKWAEIEVDDINRVHSPVRLVRERYETRVIAGLAEMFVVFQHIKRYQQNFEMFHTEYFGMISDSFLMVDDVKEGGWYKGWIHYSQDLEARTCWRLSLNQAVQGPFRTRPDYFPIQSPMRNSNYDNKRRHRSPSPNFGHERNSEDSYRNQYSPPESRSQRSDSNKVRDSEYVYVPSGIPYVEEQDSYPSSIFSSAGPSRQRCDQYDIEYARNSDNDNKQRQSKAVSTPLPAVMDSRSSNSVINDSKDKRVIRSDESQSNGIRSVEKEVAVSNPDSTQSNDTIIEETKQAEQMLSKISNLVKSFTDDPTVSISMKLWSLEEYDELTTLADKYIGKN